MPASRHYVGRFAPSPTGPLHAGSVVTALASWLDARAHGGRWLLRIEDIDPPREVPGAAAQIMQCLAQLGLHWDGEICLQSQHQHRYEAALGQLIQAGRAYPCRCSRADIQRHWTQQGRTSSEPGREWPYPGTCRAGIQAGSHTGARSWRLRVPPGIESFEDRRCGVQQENVLERAGDFILRRSDGLWAYQLAVVVDDAAQGITDIVRGEDLLDSTPRQRILQRALNLATPRTLHVGLVLGADGQKLSKQNGALAVDTRRPIEVLSQAMHALELPVPSASTLPAWLSQAVDLWAARLDQTPSWRKR